MASFVTVPGAGGTDAYNTNFTINYNSNLGPLSKQLLDNAIGAAYDDGVLNFASNPTSPTTVPGSIGVFTAAPGSSVDIPEGFAVSVIAPTTGGSVSNAVFFDKSTLSNQVVLFGQGGNTLQLGEGSGTAIGSLGNQTIIGGTSGSWSVVADLGGSTAGVQAFSADASSGPGSLVFGNGATMNFASLGADTYVGGTGAATVATYGSGSLVFGGGAGSSTTLTSSASGADTYVGGAGADTIFAQNSGSLYLGGSGSLNFVNATGSPTLFGGSGDETLFSGAGTGYYVQGEGAFSLSNGGGDQFVFGSSTSSVYYGGTGGEVNVIGSSADNTFFAGAAGNVTLSSAFSSGDNLFIGGTGEQQSIFGGSGNDTFFGGAGSASIFGGGGSDVFSVVDGKATGNLDIFGFDANSVLSLQGYGQSGADAIANAQATVVGGASSLLITLSDSTKITLVGVTNINPNQTSSS